MPDNIIEWPLRAVSTDPANITELDEEGHVLTSMARINDELAGKFVRTVGDTITGPLIVQPDVMTGSQMAVRLETSRPIVVVEGAGDNLNGPNFTIRRARGTLTAPTPVKAGDQLGILRFNSIGTYTPATLAQRAQVIATALSDATDTVPPDVFIALSANSSDNAKSATVRCEARSSGTSVIISSDTFVVNAAGDVIAAGTVVAANIITSRAGAGVGGQCIQKDVDAGQTGYGVIGRCEGISLTTGSVAGVRGEAAGICSVGIGVVGVATGNAAQNYGLQAIASGAAINIGLYIGADVARAAGSYAIRSDSASDTYLRGPLGVNFAVPTHQLEVGGTTMLRGTCEITGNITASGTAHSFAAGSIGSPAVIGNTPRTIAATGSAGSAGQMVWDENFLYLRTTAGWKKVALTAI